MNKLKKCFDGITEKKETKGLTLLERSHTNPSDEYYTKTETVEDIENYLRYLLKTYNILYCPFDNDNSEFVKVLKNLGYKVINSSNDFFENEDLLKKIKDNGGAVISNPPFSKEKDIIRILQKIDIDFYLIGNLLRCRDFDRLGCYLAYYGNTIFKNEKHVPICLVSNINIRGKINRKQKKEDLKTINGKIFYDKIEKWKNAGMPIDCYIVSTFPCFEEANYFKYEYVREKGFFNAVYIKEKIL